MEVEVLASGYQVAESPQADNAGGVFFSDAIGGGLFRWSAGGVETVVPERKGIGGMALHADGGVVIGGNDLRHIRADGSSRVLLELPTGASAFNDLCSLSDGSIVVGWLPDMTAEKGPRKGAFLHCDGRSGSTLIEDVAFPNGCGVSPDGSTVYANDYLGGVIWAHDEAGNRVFARTPTGEADGLAVDVEGGVWIGQPQAASVVRFTPEGNVDRTLDFPGWHVTSLTFDADVMYLTTAMLPDSNGGALLRLAAPVPGLPNHLASL